MTTDSGRLSIEESLPELPGTWAWARLGEISEIGQGGTPSTKKPEYWNGSVPWLRSGEIDFNRIDHANATITELGLSNSAARLVPKGTVILAMTGQGLTRGRAAILDVDASTNQSCALLIPDVRIITSEFLFYYFKKEYWNIRRLDKGTNQPGLNTSIIKNFIIPIAPLSEQVRIVSKIERLLPKLRTAKRSLQKAPPILKQFRQSVLVKAFLGALTKCALVEEPRERLGNWQEDHGIHASNDREFELGELQPGNGNELPELPSDWVWVRLGPLLELRNGKSLTEKNRIETGNIPVYGGNGYVGNHSRSLVTKPTIVIGRVGANCGNVHLTPGPAWITDNAIFVSWADQHIELEYLTYFLRQSRLNELSGGTGQPYMSHDLLNPLLLPLPPKTEQRLIVTKIKELLAKADIVEESGKIEIRRISILEQSILSRAFRGGLVPQDQNDEPASVLLERERANRTVMGKHGKKQTMMETTSRPLLH